ncbi:hypothetical protein [Escherichia coli]|nr:hypothetical protein [Escherichia coli]
MVTGGDFPEWSYTNGKPAGKILMALNQVMTFLPRVSEVQSSYYASKT